MDCTFGLLNTRGDTAISAALSSRLGHRASAGFAACFADSVGARRQA